MEEIQTEELNTANPGLNSKTGGFAFSACIVAFLVAQLIFALLLSFLPQYGKAYWYVNFLCGPCGIAVAVLATLKIRKVKFKQIFPVKCSLKYYLIALLLVFGLFFSLNQINGLFMRLLGKEESETSIQLTKFLVNLKGFDVVLAIIVIAVLPALFEETMFRGLILNNTLPDAGGIRTIFLVGFAFSIFHSNPEQTVYQFIAGCLFAFIAIRSGSILPGVLMHFINNALAIILAACHAVDDAGNFAVSSGVNIALTVLGACALIGGVIWLILDKKPLEKCKKGGVKYFFLYGLVGIAVCAVLWISTFILT